MLLYALAIALSAFLLFEVQPIIAKMILPWFGGSSAVWSTCMLFFQVVLLAGYLYAHWLHEKLAARRQALVHIALLAVSLATLPALPNPAWKTAQVGHPSLRILALLSLTVGLPYFLLSSTSPLLQAWYARERRGRLPYRLFALSNFASLTALLSYPLLVEPRLPARIQALAWSAAYACFTVLCGVTAWRAARLSDNAGAVAPDAESGAQTAPSWTVRLLWLGLAASASVLLLAVTTHLTQDVAAIPFLWILPLSVYLLSFIVCFEAPRAYRRAIFIPLLAAALAFMAWRLWPYHGRMEMRAIIGAFALALFVCCMVCHGELVRLKPHPRYLTGFYVTVSMGGAAGGLFVGLFAPNVFHAYYEFPIGLALCAALAFLVMAREPRRFSTAGKRLATGALAAVLCGYLLCLGAIMREMVHGYRFVARNFYGQLRVQDEGNPAIDEDACRKLVHGVINHGEQMWREEYRRRPVTYFCPQSGIGRAMRVLEGAPRRIGILGLGCGTLAAYGRPGDTLRIYDINPLVLEIAQRDFTYLRDTPARVEVTMGDGRLALEAEPGQQFDLLVMDAFSGDSVPVHLITREAFQTYFRHLKPTGILAVNITNSYLALEPVMERAANAFGKVALAYHFVPDDDDLLCFSCSWTLILDRAFLAAHPELQTDAKQLHPAGNFRIWTDDFSNLLSILK
ncbi:MAG: fused MFS/spermidine synthase [Acidobacteriia bacterium]|nr:fused MFS/spermidine synthase [Terriglobia bacterium]